MNPDGILAYQGAVAGARAVYRPFVPGLVGLAAAGLIPADFGLSMLEGNPTAAPEITPAQLAAHPAVRVLLEETARAAADAAVRAMNPVDPAARPGGSGAPTVPMVNFNRPVRPSITRALRAMKRGTWKGAELERDLSQATDGIFFGGARNSWSDASRNDRGEDAEPDDNFAGDGFKLPSSPLAYFEVLEETGIRTPATEGAKFHEYAVRALAEGTSSLGSVTSGGPLVPIQFLTDQWVLALTSAIALRNMPDVQVVPVSSNIVELPRESAAAAALAVAENGTISPNDPTLVLQEFALKKQARLQLFSNETLADSNPAIDRIAMQMLARDVALLQDSQYLEGSGAGANVKGIRNYSGLTASSWAAATNGSTPGGDDLVRLPYDIFKANGRPSAFVMHPRTLQSIALLKDGTGRYLFTDMSVWGGPQLQVVKDGFTYPSAAVGKLLGYPVYLSTQILVNETQGSSSAASHIIYGDFSKCLILERQAVDIFTSPHFAMNADQTAIRVTARSTVALTQPTAFAVATGII